MATETEMTDVEFKEAVKKIWEFINKIRENRSELAKLFGAMSKPQLSTAKREFKGVLKADEIERLAMGGRGKIAPHLYLPERTLPANLIKQLSKPVLDFLNNPSNTINLWTCHGVKIKTVGQLNPFELNQITDKKKILDDPEDQYRKIYWAQKKKIEDLEKDADMLQRIVASRRPGYVLVIGRSQDGTIDEKSRILCPIKNLRELLPVN
jgi:hypothetical protein